MGTVVTRRRVRLWAFVLLVALLPGTTYFGHWGDLLRPLDLTSYSAAQGHNHADHCHGDVGDCGTQGASGEQPTAAFVVIGPVSPPSFGGKAPRSESLGHGIVVTPLTPPPQAA